MTNLQITFQQVLKDEEISKKAFADRHKLDPSDISRFIKQGILSKPLKAAIFKGWSSETPAIALFDAYIEDEIEASGLPLQSILTYKE